MMIVITPEESNPVNVVGGEKGGGGCLEFWKSVHTSGAFGVVLNSEVLC